MPRLFVAVACAAVMAAACDLHPHAAGAQPAGRRRTLTVMTLNIRHGVDGSDRYHLRRTVDLIARVAPDLVALQEVTRNHSMYGCDDQPAVIADGLRRATARTWYHVYAQAWFVGRDRACMERGKGDGPNTEGLAFLAPEPLGAVSQVKLWNTALGLAVRVPSAGNLTVVATHLASRASRLDSRVKQIARLLPWAEAQGSPRLLVGDFNAIPDAPELAPVLHAYRDAWAEASAAGTARGIQNGYTRPKRTYRTDFIFYTPASGLHLEWVDTVDAAALLGVEASDHRAVVARFTLP